MDREQVAAYLGRIGVNGPVPADEETLRELQLRHLCAVPFENLSVHLGEEIVLDGDALVRKVVERRRGGFCYELNGAFAALLAALGYDVTLYAARVFGPDGPGLPFDHLALRVDLAEPWLVDVGFGKFAHHPLRLADRAEQADPGGTFRIEERPGGDLDVFCDGRPEYRLETRPQALDDFRMGCWWHRTSPISPFTRSLVCSRMTETGRISLSDKVLIHTVGTERTERVLTGDAEVLAAYRDHFGIGLDRVPVVAPPRTTVPPV